MNHLIRLTIIALLLAVWSLSAETHYVSPESTNPAPPYTNWATAATTIQQAVDAAEAGAEILVTNGVYPGILAVTNPLTLLSANGPQFTVIDGGGTNACASLADGARLSGFTLTNGYATMGGGVWCASTNALLTNCTLTGNSAAWDGGGAAGGTLNNCTLIGNSATEYGGGAVGSTLNHCTLMGNAATNAGGAFYCTLYGCVLTGNVAHGVAGGACNSTLYNCTLTGNSAIAGGSIVNNADGGGARMCTLYNCVLTNNVSSGDGLGASYCTLYDCTLSRNWSASIWSFEAALYCTLSNCTLSSNLGHGAGASTLYNCVLTGNSKFGAFGSTLYNCTLTGNGSTYGGGATGCSLNNCIAYFNTAPSNANYDASCTLNYCCTTPIPTNGVGNLTNEPAFMNLAAGDFRLRPDSPCIDAGTNLMELISTDILGLPRPMDGNNDGVARFDIGACEFNPYRFEPTLHMGGDGFQFTVRGEPMKSVRIERSCDLVNWEFAGEVPIPACGQTLIDPAATTEPRLFYRASRVP